MIPALNRPLDYASFMNWFDLEGRNVAWEFFATSAQRQARPVLRGGSTEMPMRSFTGKGLVAVLQSGLPEDEVDRALFRRFLHAGNLHSAGLILDCHQSRAADWRSESVALGRAYLREAKMVLDYQGYRLAAQHAARVQVLLPEEAAWAWHVIALAEHGLNHPMEAKTAIEIAVALNRDQAEFWHAKATILEEQNQKSAAKEALTQAIALARKADEKDARLEEWREHLEQLQIGIEP